MSSYRPSYAGTGYGRPYDNRSSDRPPPPPPDHYAPPPPPPSGSDMFHFRGAAAREYPRESHGDSYRPGREAQPPQDFSFRHNQNAPAFPQDHGRNLPPRGPRNAGRGNDRSGRGRGNRRGRGGFVPKPANSRAILRADREPTPEQLPGMNDGQFRFKLDTQSDSESEDMDLGTPEPDSGNAHVDLDSEDSEDDEHPRAKRARIAPPEPVQEKPKWSNPDPYTALPPPAESKKVGEKMIKLMRKKKNETDNAGAKAAESSDFISFNFDDDEDKDGDEEEGEVSSSDRGTPPRRFSHLDHLHPDRKPASEDPPPNGMGNGKFSALGPDTSLDTWPPPPPAETTIAPARGRFEDATLRQDIAAAPTKKALKASLKRKRPEREKGDVTEEWEISEGVNSTPWRVRSSRPDDDVELCLHREIEDFYDFVKPQPFEEAVRHDLVARLESMANRWYANYRPHILAFGSFKAGLYLPTADMDLVMCSDSYMNGNYPEFGRSMSWMKKFGAKLVQAGIAKPGSLTEIPFAKVPIVKIVDNMTGLRVDISFENLSGVAADRTFTKWKEDYPAMPAIVALIKQFLVMRDMSEVHTGGLGGYSVICLVVAMIHNLQQKHGPEWKAASNLDRILLNFLDHYGNVMDYERLGIRMDPIGYVHKSQFEGKKRPKPERMLIIDPNDAENDISGGSGQVGAILDRFAKAFDALEDRLEDVERDPPDDRDSILGAVWAGNYESFRVQRERLRRVYETMHSSSNSNAGFTSVQDRDSLQQGLAHPPPPPSHPLPSKPRPQQAPKKAPRPALGDRVSPTENTDMSKSQPSEKVKRKQKAVRRAEQFKATHPGVQNVPNRLTEKDYNSFIERHGPGRPVPAPHASASAPKSKPKKEAGAKVEKKKARNKKKAKKTTGSKEK